MESLGSASVVVRESGFVIEDPSVLNAGCILPSVCAVLKDSWNGSFPKRRALLGDIYVDFSSLPLHVAFEVFLLETRYCRWVSPLMFVGLRTAPVSSQPPRFTRHKRKLLRNPRP